MAEVVDVVDDDVRMLRDSAAHFAAGTRGLARIRALRDGECGFDPGVWRQMGELGWTGLLVPEDDGGSGLGLAQACAVAQELGRTLHPEPFVASAVLAASLLARSQNAQLKRELLPRLCAGELVPALAWQEQLHAFGPSDCEAQPRQGGFALRGSKRFVRPGAACDGFIVSARMTGGTGLFWVPAECAGLQCKLENAADGGRVAWLHFEDVFVTEDAMLMGPEQGAEELQRSLDLAIVASCAELCGLMHAALELTLDYLRTRVQFGKAIGTFQALQHRAVDLCLQLELSSACLDEAVASFDACTDARQRSALTSRLKARCSDAALRITRESIQMHGAIGFTDEHDIGLYLKRALALSAWLGNGAEHRRRYAGATLSEVQS